MRHPVYLYQRVCLCVCVYLYMFLIYILGPCYFVRYFYFFVFPSSPRPFVSCHTRCRTRIPPYARCMTTLTTRPRTCGTSTKTSLGRAYYFLNIIHNNITYTKTRRIIYIHIWETYYYYYYYYVSYLPGRIASASTVPRQRRVCIVVFQVARNHHPVPTAIVYRTSIVHRRCRAKEEETFRQW